MFDDPEAHLPLRCSLRGSTLVLDKNEASVSGTPDNSSSQRTCSVYNLCVLLEGLDPVRLFEKRMNERRETGYEFNKEKLLEYNHMNFGGPPVVVETDEEANELLRNIELEAAIGNG